MVRSSWVAFSWHFLAFGLSWVSLHFLESVFSAGVVLNNGMGSNLGALLALGLG
jgi:hypothetical protein